MPLNLLKEFGLGVFLAVSVLGIAWYLLKKTFDTHSEDRKLWWEGINAERAMWTRIYEEHFADQKIGHQKSRDEHDRILQGLNKVNEELRIMNGRH